MVVAIISQRKFFLLDTQMHVRAEVQCGCKKNPIQDLNRECHARLTISGLVGMRTENKFCWLKFFLVLLRVVINFNIHVYKKHCTWRQQTEKANIYVLYAETRWAGDRAGLVDSHWLTDFFISAPQPMEFETWLEMHVSVIT